MNHVEFNGINCQSLGWYCKTKEISKPEIKTNFVEIPGRNGSLDLTEIYGNIPLGDRSVSITLIAIDFDNAQERLQELANYIHGKRVVLTEYEGNKKDSYLSYSARLEIKSHGYDGIAYTVDIEGVAEPGAYYCRQVLKRADAPYSPYGLSVPFVLNYAKDVKLRIDIDGTQTGIRMNINGNTTVRDLNDGELYSLSDDIHVGQDLVVGENTIYYTGKPDGLLIPKITISEGVTVTR